MGVAQQPQRAQDVGVALAGDEVADGGDRRRARARGAALGRDVGAEVHDARVGRAELARALLGAGGVGEHEPGARRAPASPPPGRRRRRTTDSTSPPWTEITTGTPGPRAPHRVAGGRGVVGVDEVEREARRSRRSASARLGAAHAPQLP